MRMSVRVLRTITNLVESNKLKNGLLVLKEVEDLSDHKV